MNRYAIALAALLAIPIAAKAQVQFGITIAPPAPYYEVVPAPRPGWGWAPGYWAWGGNAYVWHRGYWQPNRPGFRWVGPAWRHREGRWFWAPGRWAH